MPFHAPRGRPVLVLATVCLPALLCLAVSPARGDSVSAEAAFGGTGFSDIGVDEKLGQQAALDTTFRDEDGHPVNLGSLVTAPTILALVYYRCPNVCDYLLTGLAGAIGPLDAVPGRDFNVVTISIDPRENGADARKSRRLSLETIQHSFPAASWRFLTGDAQNIHAVADSIGFHYKRNGDGFDHPVAITVLSPNGRIVRYMFGADFLPADLKLSLMEAQRGAVGPTIARLVRICFRVDPKSHVLVFRTTRVVATITLLAAAGLVAYLLVTGRRRRPAQRFISARTFPAISDGRQSASINLAAAEPVRHAVICRRRRRRATFIPWPCPGIPIHFAAASRASTAPTPRGWGSSWSASSWRSTRSCAP